VDQRDLFKIYGRSLKDDVEMAKKLQPPNKVSRFSPHFPHPSLVIVVFSYDALNATP
jgi:hypothetical protein